MSTETDYLHRHGWRLAGSEMRDCKKTPLWKKTGVAGQFSTEEAVRRQHRGRTTEEMQNRKETLWRDPKQAQAPTTTPTTPPTRATTRFAGNKSITQPTTTA